MLENEIFKKVGNQDLITKKIINKNDKDGWNALHFAIYYKLTEILNYFI